MSTVHMCPAFGTICWPPTPSKNLISSRFHTPTFKRAFLAAFSHFVSCATMKGICSQSVSLLFFTSLSSWYRLSEVNLAVDEVNGQIADGLQVFFVVLTHH